MSYREYYYRHLPHWQPANAGLFITVRLAGTIPRSVVEEFRREREHHEQISRKLKNQAERRKQSKFFNQQAFEKWDDVLDNFTEEECWLAQDEIAAIVAEALHFRDGRVYDLLSYCIMPNHFHLVCQIKNQLENVQENRQSVDQIDDRITEGDRTTDVQITPIALPKIMQSLKRHTARQANLVLGRQGPFWHEESYDHVVRDVNELSRIIGFLPAILMAFDFVKGSIPILAIQTMGLGEVCALAGAVSAVIGHSYPLYFRFCGGKGLATTLGALLVFTPLETLVVLPVLGIVYLMITGSMVSGVLVALSILVGLNIWRGYSLVVILSPLVLLAAMGEGSLPEVLQSWRKNTDKGRLIVSWLHSRERVSGVHQVAVVTDSVASLPSELCAKERLHIVPLALIMPDGVYHDGVDIDPRTYYRRLREEQIHPKTSAPSPGENISGFSTNY